MKRRFSSRGYSILAALVFVAVLGSIAAAVNFLGTGASPIAMSAAAPVPTPAQTRQLQTPGTGQEEGTERQCTPGYDYLVTREITGNPKITPKPICPKSGQTPGQQQEITPSTQPKINDTRVMGAFAAFSVNGRLAANEIAGEGTWGELNDKQRCQVVPRTNPPRYEPKQGFKCKIRYCLTVSGGAGTGPCAELSAIEKQKLDAAVIQNVARGPLIASVVQDVPPSEQAKILRELGVTPSEQAGLNAAYTEQQQTLQRQVQANDGRIRDLQYEIDGCENCSTETKQKLEQEQARLQKENKDLQTRMQNLAAAPRADLTPPQQPALCANGQTTGCTPVPIPRPNPQGPSTFPGPGGPGAGPGGSGSPLGALGSLLQGLMKGLGGSGSGQGPACSSDPNAYQQQQQQYQMQLQQYNYQLQQYNYQQQQAYYSGGYAPTPPTPPTPCTPSSSSNTCPNPPAQPTSGCTNGTWQPVRSTLNNGHQCTTGWQCAPSTAVQPTAELSCQPKVADVGMSVAISFSCTNATGSTGSGFSTENATSGSTTTVIASPPAGATSITYALTCRNQNLTARAECAVQISKPTIVLLANPKHVASGESSRVGWVTSGMQSCTISSPQMPGFTTQNASNKSVNGIATTSPITRDTTVVLTCETIGGNTKAASTTITVGNSTSTSAMTVSSTIDGKTDVSHGATTTISWSTPNAPSNSAVGLWLVDLQSGLATGLIRGAQSPSGNYEWLIPAANSACPVDSPIVCGADLIAGRSYSIQASLYTPPDAYLGGYPPANPITPTYLDEVSTTPFKMGN